MNNLAFEHVAPAAVTLKVGDPLPGVTNPMCKWPFVTTALVEAQQVRNAGVTVNTKEAS